jgi:hypothetical protein
MVFKFGILFTGEEFRRYYSLPSIAGDDFTMMKRGGDNLFIDFQR